MKYSAVIVLIFIFAGLTVQSQTYSRYIIVDQFGYLPESKKIAVIKNPLVGFDNTVHFTPGNSYSLVNATNGTVVFTAKPVSWKNGTTDVSSGDQTWHFDFSTVTRTGTYYVLDEDNQMRSYEFRISPSVYNEVLKHAMRSFFYQRSGFAKEAKYAGKGWADGASHIGKLQDKNCRIYNDVNNAGTERDVSGGWYDAGDYNKYTNWTSNYVVEIMKAYLERPEAWADDYNIPESGNKIPDLLDEAKWGIDFLLRLQLSNGSVLSIVGESAASPPSKATGQSLYGGVSTSATWNTCAAFSIASKVYRKIGMIVYADTLKSRAIRAWNWATAHPAVLFNSTTAANTPLESIAGAPETDDYNRMMARLEAACFLFDITNSAAYQTFFDANYAQTHLIAWGYAYPFEPNNQETLLYYTTIPGATAAVADQIRSVYKNALITGSDNLPAVTSQKDPYMAHIAGYTWGSNATKGAQGSMYLNLIKYNIDPNSTGPATDAAEGYIHYIHGVNPLNMVYLSNMYRYGAKNCVNEFYHSWFANGSALWDRVGTSTYGPAPGYVTGGANPGYKWSVCCPAGCGSAWNNAICTSESLNPPLNQPDQKSYKDFNTSWPIDSWEVTENSCGYQVNYIRLLSKFVNLNYDCNGDLGGSAAIDAIGQCAGGNTGIIPETDPDKYTGSAPELELPDGQLQVAIFPNPSDGLINVDLKEPENCHILIVDVKGKTQMETCMNESGILDVRDLKPGIYVVSFSSERGKSIRKLIRN